MAKNNQMLNQKQLVYRDMVFGTLVYAVVLGFYNDYTSILYTNSYSTTFLVALVLQILTFLTLLLKSRVAKPFKGKTDTKNKIGLIGSVWFILFVSKFVFLAAIDFIFGSYVEISGFVGLLAIILTMTLVKESLDYFFIKLAD